MGRSALAGEVDRSLKVLLRHAAPAFLRLLSMEERRAPEFADVAINLPEHRVDNVLRFGRRDEPDRWALLLEWQLRPDRRSLRGWFLKTAALTQQLGAPVVLAVVYLERGRFRSFPEAYRVEVGTLATEFRFSTVRLWEHADAIRGGALPELAPLLVLCEDNPGRETLEVERSLLRAAQVEERARVDLMAVAVTLGCRRVSEQLVREVFREEVAMLKQASFIEEWLEESRREGREEGREEGRVLALRGALRRLLVRRFGPLPSGVSEQVDALPAEECEELVLRAPEAASLRELGLAPEER
jgi:predicted transposase YdaD